MILKGLVLITLAVAYTEVVSAYPPIIQAKPEQIHLAYGCKYFLSSLYIVIFLLLLLLEKYTFSQRGLKHLTKLYNI